MTWERIDVPLVPLPDVVRVPGPARNPFGRQSLLHAPLNTRTPQTNPSAAKPSGSDGDTTP